MKTYINNNNNNNNNNSNHFISRWPIPNSAVLLPHNRGNCFALYACATTHTQLSRPITSGHFTFVEFGLPMILHLPICNPLYCTHPDGGGRAGGGAEILLYMF